MDITKNCKHLPLCRDRAGKPEPTCYRDKISNSHKEMATIGYISDTGEILKTSWWQFQHECAAEFKLSERSPVLPALFAKNLPGGQPKILYVLRIRIIDHHTVIRADANAPESISDSTHWINWNVNCDYPTERGDDCMADGESDTDHNNGFENPACSEQQDVGAERNIPRLVRPTLKSKGEAE